MKTAKFEYYEATDGWRWRLKATNGKIIATGGEAYSSKRTCLGGIDSVVESAKLVPNVSVNSRPANAQKYEWEMGRTMIVETEK